jgi:hypothetical protein
LTVIHQVIENELRQPVGVMLAGIRESDDFVDDDLIPLPDHFECATASLPLSNYRLPGSDSIQTDLGSVSDIGSSLSHLSKSASHTL